MEIEAFDLRLAICWWWW